MHRADEAPEQRLGGWGEEQGPQEGFGELNEILAFDKKSVLLLHQLDSQPRLCSPPRPVPPGQGLSLASPFIRPSVTASVYN